VRKFSEFNYIISCQEIQRSVVVEDCSLLHSNVKCGMVSFIIMFASVINSSISNDMS
jgi:hypothetical protein